MYKFKRIPYDIVGDYHRYESNLKTGEVKSIQHTREKVKKKDNNCSFFETNINGTY